MSAFGMTFHDAMNFPLNQAHALCAFHRLNNAMVEMEILGEGYLYQEARKTRSMKGAKK